MDKTKVETNFSLTALEGVRVVERRKIWDDRGAVFHMLRNDDAEFKSFGEVYFSLTKAGAIKAWKLHKRAGLNLFLVSGAARLALVDGRSTSPTFRGLQIVDLSEAKSVLVVIPPGIWSGFQAVGGRDSILANCATEPHDPTESERRDFAHPEMPSPWDV